MACHDGPAGLAKASFDETAVVQAGCVLSYLMISYGIVSLTRFGLQMSCGCTDWCIGMSVKQVNHEHSLIPSRIVHGLVCLACKECRQLALSDSAHYTGAAVNGMKDILLACFMTALGDRGQTEKDHLEAQHKGQSGPSGRREHSHHMECHTAQQVSMACRRRPLYSHASPWLGGSSHLAATLSCGDQEHKSEVVCPI